VLKAENWHITYRWARRIAISIVGGTVLAIGVAMIVLPGPALVVIPLGLAILGVEYAWARRWLRKVKARTAAIVARVRTTAGFGLSAASAAESAADRAPEATAPRETADPADRRR
jgi:tellurite resistance protein TerC